MNTIVSANKVSIYLSSSDIFLIPRSVLTQHLYIVQTLFHRQYASYSATSMQTAQAGRSSQANPRSHFHFKFRIFSRFYRRDQSIHLITLSYSSTKIVFWMLMQRNPNFVHQFKQFESQILHLFYSHLWISHVRWPSTQRCGFTSGTASRFPFSSAVTEAPVRPSCNNQRDTQTYKSDCITWCWEWSSAKEQPSDSHHGWRRSEETKAISHCRAARIGRKETEICEIAAGQRCVLFCSSTRCKQRSSWISFFSFTSWIYQFTVTMMNTEHFSKFMNIHGFVYDSGCSHLLNTSCKYSFVLGGQSYAHSGVKWQHVYCSPPRYRSVTFPVWIRFWSYHVQVYTIFVNCINVSMMLTLMTKVSVAIGTWWAFTFLMFHVWTRFDASSDMMYDLFRKNPFEIFSWRLFRLQDLLSIAKDDESGVVREDKFDLFDNIGHTHRVFGGPIFSFWCSISSFFGFQLYSYGISAYVWSHGSCVISITFYTTLQISKKHPFTFVLLHLKYSGFDVFAQGRDSAFWIQ